MTAPRPAEEPVARLRELVEEIVVAPGWREELREAAAAVERERDEARAQNERLARDSASLLNGLAAAEARLAAVEAALLQGGQSPAIRAQQALFALADAPVPPQPEPTWQERVEYGHQTTDDGWFTELRGIKYATHQRTMQFRQVGEPVFIDHWTYADHRHPVQGCQFCADLAAKGEQPQTTRAAVDKALPVAQPEPERCEHGLTEAHRTVNAAANLGCAAIDCPGPVSPQSAEETP